MELAEVAALLDRAALDEHCPVREGGEVGALFCEGVEFGAGFVQLVVGDERADKGEVGGGNCLRAIVSAALVRLGLGARVARKSASSVRAASS